MQPSPSVESYVKVLWWRRWKVVGTTFAVAAVTAVISLLLPKTFESTAKLMALPSQEKLDTTDWTPAVQTYQALLRSPKYLKEVLRWLIEGKSVIDYATEGKKLTPAHIQGIRVKSPVEIVSRTSASLEVAQYVIQLDDDGLIGLADFDLDELEEMSVEDLGESLFADVTEEKKTAIDIIFSPIIHLRARGKTARQASTLANVWAAVFLHTYGDLIRSNAERAHEYWKSMAKDWTDAREKKLNETLAFRLRYNLEFLQGWMDQATGDYRKLEDDLARQQLDLDHETSRMVSLQRMVNAIEDDGTWIGAKTVDAALRKPGVAGMYLDMRENVIAAARRMRRTRSQLDLFLDKNDLDTLRKETERAGLDLVNFQSRLKEETIRADQTSRTLASIREQLAGVTPTLKVKRSADAGPGEIVNPEWEELQLERIRLEVAYSESRAVSAKLSTYLNELGGKVHEQSSRLRKLEIEHERLRTNLDQAIEESDGYQQAYAQLKREIYDTAQRLGPLEARVEHLRAAVAALRTRIDDTMTSVTQGQTGLALREAEDETAAEFVKLAQERFRESELAVARQSLDVRVAAEAIPPTKKIRPQRTLMVLAMAFLGFFVSVGCICGRHYLVSTGFLTP